MQCSRMILLVETVAAIFNMAIAQYLCNLAYHISFQSQKFSGLFQSNFTFNIDIREDKCAIIMLLAMYFFKWRLSENRAMTVLLLGMCQENLRRKHTLNIILVLLSRTDSTPIDCDKAKTYEEK